MTSQPAPYVQQLRSQARELEQRAHEMRLLAFKIEEPPEGVTVEFYDDGSVWFVGPPVDLGTVA